MSPSAWIAALFSKLLPAPLRSLRRRWLLWALLAALVLALLVTVIWLTGRHEVEQVQARLERDTQDAVSDLLNQMKRNSQSMQGLGNPNEDPVRWTGQAAALLHSQREVVQIEWRDAALNLVAAVKSPYWQLSAASMQRNATETNVVLACAAARKQHRSAYSSSHFLPATLGDGVEAMELCIPVAAGGFMVATYSLREVLTELLMPSIKRGQQMALTELDGTRLVTAGTAPRTSGRMFVAQQLVDLPGVTLMLQVSDWRIAPDALPNALTVLVTLMSIALVSVLVLLARDTRRRELAEDRLSDALAFRKAMEDSTPTGLRVQDLSGRTTYINAALCEMVGYSAEELFPVSGAPPYWPVNLAHEAPPRHHRIGSTTHSEGREIMLQRKDGSHFPTLIFEAPLLTAQFEQTGWMTTFVDVSEQRRIEELARAGQDRLQASARLATVGEMASLMSHELTQPLAAIASYANGSLNLMSARHPPALSPNEQSELTQVMRHISQQAERAGQIIRSVRDVVRRRERSRERIAARTLFDAVLPLVELQANKLRARVLLEVPDGLPDVVCDHALIEQVLLNLSRNGMQAMAGTEPAMRTLTLRVTLDDANAWVQSPPPPRPQRVRFSVADLGEGLDDATAARLFTPFFTTRAEGMGLGLSLCRTVVEQHGSALVHRPNQPCGTVFEFALPVAGDRTV